MNSNKYMRMGACSQHLQNPQTHTNARSEIATRHDPIDLALRSLKVEKLHVNTVLPLLLDVDPCEEKPKGHANAELPQVVSRLKIANDALPERIPCAFPVHFVSLGNFLLRSVRHWDS